MQSRERRSKRRQIVEQLAERDQSGEAYGVPRGVQLLGLNFFPSYPRRLAKLLLIAALGLVIALGGCFGIVFGVVVLETALGVDIPDRILAKAMRGALLSVIGLTVTIVGVLIHASGSTEDPRERRPQV
ncbi:hypothetical protein A3770_04p28810 [Chloropicon primus]|uniref:Uncharacterized protein n=1 Tax=Chloropicon primus TaxID=1764295 RepID=A0A5B8MIT5_9CHLO|nr:hypothetical protein A3770_04p28810 [Chloropicon primus]|eukprot:QDZ20363.1 hypothetical protein A3770_04p28810 [Chloropicon primus]